MIDLRGIVKSYRTGAGSLPVLRGIDLRIAAGEFVAIMGPSGAGKSSLLNVLDILDSYDDGEYYLNKVRIKDLSEAKAAYYRSRLIGFIFQSFNLLPFKTAVENVALPLYYRRVARGSREEIAWRLLDRVGLSDRATHRPGELSGGQCQRVAVARALVGDPPVILADEPTGNLDSQTSLEVMDLLAEINREGKTLLVVTHSDQIAALAHRVVRFHDGRIIQDN